MLLLQLPPEILRQIFDYCGSSYFQENPTRLTVSNRWYEFALPAYWKHLALSPIALDCLTRSRTPNRSSSLRNNLQSLTIQLGGNQEFPPVSEIADAENTTISDGVQNHGAGNQPSVWIRKLNTNIEQLIMSIKSSYKLHTLKLHALPLPPPGIIANPEPYVLPRTIQESLTLINLRHLVLDISSYFIPESGGDTGHLHICHTVGRLLQTLETLHLRLPSICLEALAPPESSTTIPLTNLVVNLSLYSDVSGITLAPHSSRCNSGQGGLLESMRKQADNLTRRMASPKVVRILTYLPVHFELQSFDVLTGKIMKLDVEAEWDDDGEIVEEDEPEPEFTDSDADDSFFDDDENEGDGDGDEEE